MASPKAPATEPLSLSAPCGSTGLIASRRQFCRLSRRLDAELAPTGLWDAFLRTNAPQPASGMPLSPTKQKKRKRFTATVTVDAETCLRGEQAE